MRRGKLGEKSSLSPGLIFYFFFTPCLPDLPMSFAAWEEIAFFFFLIHPDPPFFVKENDASQSGTGNRNSTAGAGKKHKTIAFGCIQNTTFHEQAISYFLPVVICAIIMPSVLSSNSISIIREESPCLVPLTFCLPPSALTGSRRSLSSEVETSPHCP